MDLEPSDIYIEDIAHGLANTCRFSGQVPEFYSVAQHSIHVAEQVRATEYGLCGLLHDASEAYLCDVPRPVKKYLGGNYASLENLFMHIIAKRFEFQWPMPEEVKSADNAVLEAEFRDLWGGHLVGEPICSPMKTRVRPWTPKEAELRFLNAFQLLLA